MSEDRLHMFDYLGNGLALFIFRDHKVRSELIAWCEEELGYCYWKAEGDHKNNRVNTVYYFLNTADAMAFKLRWA